ncbi:DUF2306 domain-containing protein [Hoyosella rhizosphaerae]|uniref:DUF2306 domain-containing protein n=1 Tax=Hoyosella rhizosphaerae TaxID=1755582 RepID=A0A916X996_9ACTN|nr:DUF2306 domain-containing protein [Hoyosella rhizosphaerae]MBN4926796.1 DUF2306 domain-containing protein [Hoyosella rhizosphaerae]GGC56379.1 hypothetical protein GCM10011410_06080 [Hoyosella rhizosphaerae]
MASNGSKSNFTGKASWLALAVICFVYAPMAIEYMWSFFGISSPQLWISAFSQIVSETHATGPGSVELEQAHVYTENRIALLIHTMAGGLAILLAIAQFSNRLRARHLALHRVTGRIFVGLVVVSMITAMIYLVRVGPDGSFDGPAFHLQLWFLAIGTLVATIAAVVAIRSRKLWIHQSLMAYSFALLLTAPLLRVQYLIYGTMDPTYSQELTNTMGAIVLGFAVVSGAILASRHFSTPGQASIPAIGRVDVVTWTAGALGVGAIAALHQRWIGDVTILTVTLMVSFAVFLGVFILAESIAGRGTDQRAVADWRIHRRALTMAPPVFLTLWLVYSLPFTAFEAFYGAALTAPATALTIGFALTLAKRRANQRLRPGGNARPAVVQG